MYEPFFDYLNRYFLSYEIYHITIYLFLYIKLQYRLTNKIYEIVVVY